MNCADVLADERHDLGREVFGGMNAKHSFVLQCFCHAVVLSGIVQDYGRGLIKKLAGRLLEIRGPKIKNSEIEVRM